MHYMRPYDITTNLEFPINKRQIEIVLLFTYQVMKFVGPKRGGVPVEWRILHNEEIYVLLFTQNIIRVTKSGRLRRTGHVAV